MKPDIKSLMVNSSGPLVPLPRRLARGVKFIAGPIPLEYILHAGRLPGKCLQVVLVLLYMAGLKRSRTVFLSQKVCRKAGVSRFSSYRALRGLEVAGLITVVRKQGRSAYVTLLFEQGEALRDQK